MANANETQRIEEGTIDRMIRELASDLAALVESGDLTDQEANEWMVSKQDQWAQGI
jgi:hypothetical protein